MPFGLNSRHAERLAVRGRRAGPAERVLRQVQHLQPALRQYRLPDGRLVPQGDQDARRPERPEDAHRRLRRQGPEPSSAWCRSRSPAATSTRRWRRAPSTPPSGSAPTTTRSSASTRSRPTTTIPAAGRAARRCTCSSTRRSGPSCRKTYQAIAVNAAHHANTYMQARYDARQSRRRSSSWSAAGRAAAALLAGDHGGGLQGGAGGLCRDLGPERRLQEALRHAQAVPRRRLSVVAGGRVQLRQLLDPQRAPRPERAGGRAPSRLSSPAACPAGAVARARAGGGRLPAGGSSPGSGAGGSRPGRAPPVPRSSGGRPSICGRSRFWIEFGSTPVPAPL